MNAFTKNKKLNILVLHWLRDPKEARDVLLKLAFFLKKYKSDHNYIYHDVSLPLPDYIKGIHFDAIILDVTLLCLRYPYHDKYFRYFKKNFWELKDLECVKIAFPQDDYDCCEILDNWMVEWNIDLVFSPLADNPEIDVIYPKYKNQGKIELSYTGYIDRDFFSLTEKSKPFKERTIDLCYRARRLPPYFGKIGEIKWRIADLVKEKVKSYNLRYDISCANKDVILGERWYEFLGNSKFTLGSLSGSSLVDPKGKIQEKVKRYCKEHPNYTYEEVERLFFPGQDKYQFTAISPRNIESAFTMTGQVLVKGPYSGILEPWEDYIPLEPDASNFYEVYKAMTDVDFSQKMIRNCYEKIISKKSLYYEDLADRLINYIYEHQKVKSKLKGDNINWEKIVKQYEKEYAKKYKFLFLKRRIIRKIELILLKYPKIHEIAKRLYNLVKF